jgi:hypothetical protein
VIELPISLFQAAMPTSFGSTAVWAGAGVGLPGIGVAAGALGSLVACAIFIVSWPSAQTQMSADAISIITAQRIVRIFPPHRDLKPANTNVRLLAQAAILLISASAVGKVHRAMSHS